ncbi:DNA helicase II [Methylicorpusculum sp.]|uniref:DNA helicase II n=1 Tax=Methylicorpusculum sp. TaxID=2713644 RepID=UPI0027178251|nr:DNA helicase II [Methylicorpusculum sp.]MDO8844249.1 DNA helicase II [Methylicorpusculum sp.]MDP3531486.1 DNA helicase II [Methylicorpusculum sp.]MDZ4151077.1 DNA helicase II [Methylicorpusculum sp.]
MDITNIINPLNDAQRQAVSAPLKPILVLAGAGSGKTRVLVHRIAWLIQVEGVSPHSILAVTFTNKAAAEMRTRVESLLGMSARSMWIGTFHGLAHRLLRRHAQQAGLPESFQVMDSDDQLRVIKRILKSLNLDDARWPPKQAQWYINAQKDEGVRARHMAETGDFYLSQMRAVYRMYEDICQQSGLVDFAELLLRAHELLRDIPDVLAFYQARFLHVLVDEFQDTNTIQYAWLRLLTGGKDNLFVVGDDDQSIYGWRGAKIENIYQFQQHYPEHKVIKLEQNYRSTGHILKAANHVIARNEGRMGKELWTDSGLGDLISLYSAFNEQDEAYFVVERIRKWVNEGGARSEVAILYRSNAQSRQFEERLMNTGTPYRVYGGLRFFERAEVKNALAYLRLIANAEDDASFERVVNTPARGIGAKALDDLRLFARDQRLSLWQATEALIAQQRLTPRASGALAGFLKLIGKMAAETSSLSLFEKVKKVVEHSGLIELYQKEKGDKGEARVENLEELVNAAKAYVFDQDNEEQMGELDMFLAHAALESGDMQGDDFEDCVQLMTLHSAKGLEFNLVFVVGIEEGLFPSQQSVEDAGRLEEERRLCYVGMTRAKKQLILTYAESRRIYGRETNPRPSRFLKEIPADTLQEVRLRAQVSRPVTAVSTLSDANRASASFRLGQRVKHEKFGEGVVLQIDGSGDQERAQINFSDAGMKWLMLAYANLQRLH